MDLIDTIMTRRSIRRYTDQEVSEDLIETILQAGMAAPSAANQRPWHFITVRDRKKLEAIEDFHKFASMLKNASASIIVCGAPEGKKWPQFWVQDCSAATQNMLLAARALGLGSVWVGIYPLEERLAGMRKLFNIPESVFPFAVIPVGWPVPEFKAKDRYDASLIHTENW